MDLGDLTLDEIKPGLIIRSRWSARSVICGPNLSLVPSLLSSSRCCCKVAVDDWISPKYPYRLSRLLIVLERPLHKSQMIGNVAKMRFRVSTDEGPRC